MEVAAGAQKVGGGTEVLAGVAVDLGVSAVGCGGDEDVATALGTSVVAAWLVGWRNGRATSAPTAGCMRPGVWTTAGGGEATYVGWPAGGAPCLEAPAFETGLVFAACCALSATLY